MKTNVSVLNQENISWNENKTEIDCLTLIPYEANTLLVNRELKLKILNLIRFLLSEMIQSLKSFYKDNQLKEFDPHVGDTLCQIRAYQFCLMKENNLLVEDKIDRLNSILKKSQGAIEEFNSSKNSHNHYNKTLDKKESLVNFLETHSLLFKIDVPTSLLIQARILTTYSKIENKISKGIEYEKLCEKNSLTKTLAKKLMHHFQVNLTKQSCDFVKNLSLEYSVNRYEKTLNSLKLIDGDKRHIYPCYLVTKILLNSALNKNTAILVRVEKSYIKNAKPDFLLFVPNKASTDFDLRQDLYHLYFDRPCVVIFGTTSNDYNTPPARSLISYINQFETTGLKKIILANMATHPQYSAQEFENFGYNPYQACNLKNLNTTDTLETEFLELKEFGEKAGCSLNNDALFLVKHIFCDYPRNQLKDSYSIKSLVELQPKRTVVLKEWIKKEKLLPKITTPNRLRNISKTLLP